MNSATSAVALSDQQVSDYHEQGYLVLRGVFRPEEVAVLSWEANSLAERHDLIDTANIRCRWQDHVETGACTFDCFDPVIDIGPVCRAFANDERLLSALGAIYRDRAHLLKDKLIFKPPGAKGYALHQDYISWKEFPRSFVTVILPIDATRAENGATEVFPGYHRRGYLSPIDGDYHELSLEAIDPACGVMLELDPGDIALFGGFTPHRSAPNTSGSPRRQLYLSYNAERDGGAQREAHYAQFHEWLRVKYAQFGRTGIYFR